MKGIYQLYYKNNLVYTGKSLNNMRSRVFHHINVNKLFDKAVLHKIERDSDIAVLETYLIAMLKPKYNYEYNYKDSTTIEFDISKYLTEDIIMIKEIEEYKESIRLTKEKEIIDLSIKQMFNVGIPFEDIIQVVNELVVE